MELDKLIVKLALDASQFVQGLENAKTQAQDKVTGISKTLQGIGGSMAKIGAIGTASITAPLVALGFASTNAASDLSESMNKVQVIFGSDTSIVSWSQNAATAMGMSQQTALEAAGTYGNLFTSMGLTSSEAEKMSTSVVSLSADLASFNNLAPEDVLNKLRAGLTGETEPLKSLGINMNQAGIEAQAMKMGFEKVNGTFTNSQLIAARYALIMEATKNAQGDFSRTSDGLANSQRILNAQMEDAKSKLGQGLLPIATKVVSFFNGLLEKFNALSPAMQQGILIAGGVIAAIFPLISIIGGLASGIGALIPLIAGISAPILPIIGIIAGVIAVIALLKLAWDNNFGGIRDSLTAFYTNTIQPIFSGLVTWFQTNLPIAINVLKQVWAGLQPVFQVVGNILQNFIFPVLGLIANIIQLSVVVAFKVLEFIIKNTIVPIFNALYKNFTENILPTFTAVTTWLNDHLSPAFNTLGTIINKVAGWVSNLVSKLSNLDVPEIFKPGSPPPLYYAFKDIGDQMQRLGEKVVPEMNAELQANAQLLPGTQLSGDKDYQGVIDAINMSASKNRIDTNQLIRGIRDGLLQAGIGGA